MVCTFVVPILPCLDRKMTNLYHCFHFSAADNLNNGSASLSPPHGVSQRETTQITQPASATSSPLASPGLTNTNFNLCPGPSTLDPNWQATKPSVRERNAAMFNNELIADVKFVVGTPGMFCRLWLEQFKIVFYRAHSDDPGS